MIIHMHHLGPLSESGRQFRGHGKMCFDGCLVSLKALLMSVLVYLVDANNNFQYMVLFSELKKENEFGFRPAAPRFVAVVDSRQMACRS